MRISACQCCGESINAGMRGPLPIKCGPCRGYRRPNGPPLPKKARKRKPTKERIRSDQFTFLPGRIKSECGHCRKTLWLCPGKHAKHSRHFCSRHCQWSVRKTPEERIRSDRFTFVPGRVETSCGHCKKTLWIAPKLFAEQQHHFCGRSCRGLASRYAVPHRFHCVRCGEQCSIPGNPRQKHKGLYCSRKCAAATRGEKKSAERAVRVSWGDLGKWFHAWGQQEIDPRVVALERLLFPSAKRLHRIKLLRVKKERAKRKSGKLRSRCKRFGVEYDSRVSRLSVCNRDGWICAMCGVKTIKEVNRKHPHPLEGTLDHIIPLSMRTKGNTWDNAQCACRRCNCQKKRDRLLCCQMRLF